MAKIVSKKSANKYLRQHSMFAIFLYDSADLHELLLEPWFIQGLAVLATDTQKKKYAKQCCLKMSPETIIAHSFFLILHLYIFAVQRTIVAHSLFLILHLYILAILSCSRRYTRGNIMARLCRSATHPTSSASVHWSISFAWVYIPWIQISSPNSSNLRRAFGVMLQTRR